MGLSIARKLSADEFNINESVMPFDDLDENFLSQDALFSDWPEADAIIGNPPFHGKRTIREKNIPVYNRDIDREINA